jgi:hypothetical protein
VVQLIGAGQLLLVVSHLFAVPVLVLWVGLRKNKESNSDVRITLQGYILSTAGDAITLGDHLQIFFCKPKRKKKKKKNMMTILDCKLADQHAGRRSS